jgi:N utilization substance protein A
MERERGIDREVLIQAMEFALKSAARKTMSAEGPYRVEIDRETLGIKAFAEKKVVKGPNAGPEEVVLSRALLYKADAKVGDMVEIEVVPKDLGRIAAQTAKQAILQKIREAEKERVIDEYKNRVGDIVTGSVRQFNRSDIVVDLGRGEAVLPAKERVPTEEYQIGDRIRALIVSVDPEAPGPGVMLSRSDPEFVRALFKLEVTEIGDGTVEIKGMAREPGYRTKIAVSSKDAKVDPVGACVGMRGTRVKNIVRELSGEKIDIIRWTEDIKAYVTNALSPAKIAKIWLDENIPNMVHVTCEADQLSLAIGKRGQNVRLTARLVGWKIDIQRDESHISFEEKVSLAVERLGSVPGIGSDHAGMLVKAGYLTVEGILAAEAADSAEATGMSAEEAAAMHDAASAAQVLKEPAE